jgi:hypothetical protein
MPAIFASNKVVLANRFNGLSIILREDSPRTDGHPTDTGARRLAPNALATHEEGTRAMQESELCATAAKPVPGFCLAPLGLSDNDCQAIADVIRSTAPGWQTDLQEDAFGQLALIMAPSMANRLQLALMAYRIDAGWFLEEVSEGAIRDVGEFQTAGEFQEALGSRLEHYSAIQASDGIDRQ